MANGDTLAPSTGVEAAFIAEGSEIVDEAEAIVQGELGVLGVELLVKGPKSTAPLSEIAPTSMVANSAAETGKSIDPNAINAFNSFGMGAAD